MTSLAGTDSWETDDPRRAAPQARLLPVEALRRLNRRSDAAGALQTAIHIGLLGLGGVLIALSDGIWLIPAMVLQGVFVATLFAPLHESVHFTTFRTRWLNLVVGWLAGAANLYNAEHYKFFHYAHHRYTQDPARDPELVRSKPRGLGQYLLRVGGAYYWLDRVATLWLTARGDFSHMPYIPASARAQVMWSGRGAVALYAAIAIGAVAADSIAPLVYWLIPAVLGQPVLRWWLLAEHTGCTEDANGLTNTRTTLTTWPVRLVLWNLPYHAEHHLYPSIPFHQLAAAHALIRDRLGVITPGYIAFHRDWLAGLRR